MDRAEIPKPPQTHSGDGNGAETMSISPSAIRLMRWQSRHRILTDSVLSLLVLGLDVLLSLAPLLISGELPSFESWLPATIAATALCTAALCLRRTRPATAWAAVVIVPVLHHLTIRCTSGLDPENIMVVTGTIAAYFIIGTPLCLIALAMRYRPVWAWTAAVASALPFWLVLTWPGGLVTRASWSELLIFILINVIAALIGTIMRIQDIQLREVEARSARLVLAREQEALLAAANERGRIAREMHDVVAHSLAVMITMSDGAAAAIDRNPQMAKEALKVLAETGRTALADTRRLVGVLRDDPGASSDPAASGGNGGLSGGPGGTAADPAASGGPGEPAAPSTAPARAPLPRRRRPRSAGSPGTGGSIPVVRDLPVPEFAPPGTVAPAEPSEQIADLRRRATDAAADRSTGQTPTAPAPEQADLAVLVTRFQTAGVPVKYSWIGRELPDDKGLQLTLFRIAQEAMTNILRYAPTTKRVEVTVSRHAGTAVLTVDNDAAPGSRPMHGSGKGLIGMRERAAVYGGTVDAGPTSAGWRVRAVLRWDEDDEGTSPWQMPL